MAQPTEQLAPISWRRFVWPDWQRRKRMLRREAWAAIIGTYVLLAGAYLLPEDFRSTSTAYVLVAWVAFLARVLQYHLGLLLLVIAVAACVVRRWRMATACVPVVLFALLPAWWHFGPGKTAGTAGGPALRVMSVNLLMINRNTGPIIKEIRRIGPDVLLLQEYTAHWHDAISGALGEEYPHAIYLRQEDSFGTAIYSRRPFVGRPSMDVPLGSSLVTQMRAVVEIGGQQVALYNLHLLPPRMLSYTIEHRRQMADLLDMLRREKLPAVVAGDFNFTETTSQAWAVRRIGYADAQDLAGRWRGATWPVNTFLRYLPGLRLDHVFVSGDLACTRCETGVGEGSDHRPIVAEVAVTRGGTGAGTRAPGATAPGNK